MIQDQGTKNDRAEDTNYKAILVAKGRDSVCSSAKSLWA
jgi:hypothetical protein